MILIGRFSNVWSYADLSLPFLPPHGFLSEAWHVVTTVDAFLDSDNEDIDEPARHAYGIVIRCSHGLSSHF
jgi:hypothetical protein